MLQTKIMVTRKDNTMHSWVSTSTTAVYCTNTAQGHCTLWIRTKCLLFWNWRSQETSLVQNTTHQYHNSQALIQRDDQSNEFMWTSFNSNLISSFILELTKFILCNLKGLWLLSQTSHAHAFLNHMQFRNCSVDRPSPSLEGTSIMVEVANEHILFVKLWITGMRCCGPHCLCSKWWFWSLCDDEGTACWKEHIASLLLTRPSDL